MSRKGYRILPARLVAVLMPLMVLSLPSCAQAHVIPNDAKIQAFLKPEGLRLRLLVRVPLETMVDLTYPTRGSSELLDLDRADRVLRELAALWIANNIDAYEGNRLLAYPQVVDVRASLAFDGSFASYEQAIAHVRGPRLTNSVDFVWNQGLLDVLLEYPIESDRSRFSIHSKLSTLAVRTTTSLRFLKVPLPALRSSEGPALRSSEGPALRSSEGPALRSSEGKPDTTGRPAAGGIAAFEFVGDPGLIALEPTWSEAAARFARTGFLEILHGADYWLFLFVLVIPLQRWRALVPVAVSFAAAEAITLSPSSSLAPDTLWFQPLIGLLIASAIVYTAIENGMGVGGTRRWMMAFGFGLLLGLRFSLALRGTLQFAGAHALTSLASFGIGADLGQLFLLFLLLPAVQFLFRLATERAATFVVSLMAGDISWHWMRDRAELLRQYQFQWPAATPALTLAIVTWATDLVIAAAVFWLLFTAIRRSTSGNRPYGEGDGMRPAHADTGTSVQ